MPTEVPFNLLTGAPIDTGQALAWDNQKEFHHFFPRDYLKNRDIAQQRINCLANIVMLTSASNKRISNRAPSAYLAEVEAAAGGDLPAWLEANLISQEAFEAAKADDFGRFLSVRAETLHRVLLPLAGWSSEEATEPAVDTAPLAPGTEEDDGDDSDFTDEPPTGDAVAPS